MTSSGPRRLRRALDGPGPGSTPPHLVPPGSGTEGFLSAALPCGPLASAHSPEGHSKEASGLHPSTAAVPLGQGCRDPHSAGWLASGSGHSTAHRDRCWHAAPVCVCVRPSLMVVFVWPGARRERPEGLWGSRYSLRRRIWKAGSGPPQAQRGGARRFPGLSASQGQRKESQPRPGSWVPGQGSCPDPPAWEWAVGGGRQGTDSGPGSLILGQAVRACPQHGVGHFLRGRGHSETQSGRGGQDPRRLGRPL